MNAPTVPATAADRERALVRELARRVIEAASDPHMEEVRRRWRDVNALRKPDRAPVWLRPVGAWDEIIPREDLVCDDPWLRGLELGFRRTLHKLDIGDDEPVEPCFDVHAVVERDQEGAYGVPVKRERPGEAGGSWRYDPPLRDEADFGRLRSSRYTVNEEESHERLSRMEDLLGDVAPVRLVCRPPFGATLGNAAADLRGLERVMLDMAASPEQVHRLMAFLRDAALDALDQYDEQARHLYVPNNTGPMTTSDPVGPQPVDGGYSTRNFWCMANSQEFGAVSPAMWEEFCLAYQEPIFERAGLVGYGCCEDLTRKIEGVLSIPNLRIFVSSAWTDLDKVVDACGDRYCIMWRQKATDVVFPDDIASIRRHLDEGARRLRGCRYQIVLRELQTLRGHADRLHVWTGLAREAAAKYA